MSRIFEKNGKHNVIVLLASQKNNTVSRMLYDRADSELN